ncbi:MAG: hypothetical protein Q8942_16415 [Bacillota bacterium]|nr:hypothetical protein [Bacillota bacterium]
MSSSNYYSRDKFSKENFKLLIKELRLGDSELRESFIDENKSYILKSVSKALKRSVVPQNSAEFEIGLTSFNYAIDNYDLDSEDDFLTYADKVIKNSIYNFMKEANTNSTAFTSHIENEYLYRDYENKDEISHFKHRLWQLGITIDALVHLTPDDEEQIKLSIATARKLTYNPDIFKDLSMKASIPYDLLDRDIRNNKKFIEKHKAYILALTIILDSQLGIFKSYLKNIEAGNQSPDNVGIILEHYKQKSLIFTLQGKFSITKIKNNANIFIGKQLVINGNNVKKPSGTVRYLLFAAGFFVITLTVLLSFTYLLNRDTPTEASKDTSKEPLESQKVTVAQENITKKPSQPALTTSINKSAALKTPDKAYATPTTEVIRPTATKSKITKKPKPTKNTPAPTPKTVKALGAPDLPVISCDMASVNIGDTYTVLMNMAGGNNGTVIVLYENNKIVLYKRCKDNSPDQQFQSMSFKAKSKGVFQYRYKLINSIGSTSSETITVNVN